MIKKNLFKQMLTVLAILSACLLLAAAPLPSPSDPEDPGAETTSAFETEENEDETQPGNAPLNDHGSNDTVRK